MALTLADYIIIGAIILAEIFITIVYAATSYGHTIRKVFICIIISIVIVAGAIFGFSWWNTHTASGARAMKDYESNMDNGLDRYLMVIADDGTIVYDREGHFDLEIHDNYIVFDEYGNRTIIYKSYTSTLVIEELYPEEW